MDTLIEAVNIGLEFSASSERRRSLKEWVLDALRGRIRRKGFKAIDNISFKINRGEAVGLIGRNGAGKSTLLKMVTGIADPTSGKISVRGQVAPLLALGNGLDPTLTGRENIYLNGAILGYTKEYLKAKEESIIEFSELGDFIDSPVRAYSSGMMMRLAFSIATAASPEILILDEVLAVGDATFQEKCRNRISQILEDGTTIFFVSHNLDDIQKLCTRVIWIEKGHIVRDGKTDIICPIFKIHSAAPFFPINEIENQGNSDDAFSTALFTRRNNTGHFITINYREAGNLYTLNQNWNFVRNPFKVFKKPINGTSPMFRLYHQISESHIYIVGRSQCDEFKTKNPLWIEEGIPFYVYTNQMQNTIPIYTIVSTDESNMAMLFAVGDAEKVSILEKNPSYVLFGDPFFAYPCSH